MSTLIDKLLAVRGIHLTEEESKMFQFQWKQIRSLKKDFDEVSSNQEDINLCYQAKGGMDNE
jgi:hemerythrin